ncbi:hypothetical protein BH23CYA1_BH23CYA1_16530 [soil metagenome]
MQTSSPIQTEPQKPFNLDDWQGSKSYNYGQ